MFNYGSIRGEEFVTYSSNNKLLKKNSVPRSCSLCVSPYFATRPHDLRSYRVQPKFLALTKQNCNSRTGAGHIFQIKPFHKGPTRDEVTGEWRRLHN